MVKVMRNVESNRVATTAAEVHMHTNQTIIVARKHVACSSSRLCLSEAVKAQNEGRLDDARMWAVKSLTHSVGVFHPDHARATA